MSKEKNTSEKKSLRRMLSGSVTKVIDNATAKVRVERKFPHPKYGKIIKTHKQYIVHTNEPVEIGNVVTIGEIKPISKRKTWEVVVIEK